MVGLYGYDAISRKKEPIRSKYVRLDLIGDDYLEITATPEGVRVRLCNNSGRVRLVVQPEVSNVVVVEGLYVD